jgi:hypothetical protein
MEHDEQQVELAVQRGQEFSLIRLYLKSDGAIELSGQNIGPTVQEFFDHDDYEYMVTVPSSAVAKLAFERSRTGLPETSERWSSSALIALESEWTGTREGRFAEGDSEHRLSLSQLSGVVFSRLFDAFEISAHSSGPAFVRSPRKFQGRLSIRMTSFPPKIDCRPCWPPPASRTSINE